MNIEAHLNECSEAEEFRALVLRLRALPEREPSTELHDRTMALLAIPSAVSGQTLNAHLSAVALAEVERLTFNAQFKKLLLAAAAGLALLLSAVYVLRTTPPPLSEDLQWLLAQQEDDGTWNPARQGGAELFRPALTACSVLALHKSASDRCSDALKKGMAALEQLQNSEGFFKSADAQSQAYNLAMTTFALARCAPQMPAARPLVERAVKAIQASQLPNGSWDYAATPEGNIAITSWMIRALKDAEASGVGTSQTAQRKGLRWLLRATSYQNGCVSYRPAEQASDTLTALTAISFITAGGAFPDLQSCARQMTDRLAQHTRPASQRDCYRDYAKIEALELAGKPSDALRVRQAMTALRDSPDTWQLAGGQLYTVAFTALCK